MSEWWQGVMAASAFWFVFLALIYWANARLARTAYAILNAQKNSMNDWREQVEQLIESKDAKIADLETKIVRYQQIAGVKFQ